MSGVKNRKKGGGKLTRSETVTVRLDPKLRYLSELAARSQRRTLSSYIEWTLQQSLNDVVLVELYKANPLTLSECAELIWDVDPVHRMLKLATQFSGLLNFEEQLLYEVIQSTGWFWDDDPVPVDWGMAHSLSEIKLDRLHRSWDAVESRAKKEISQDEYESVIKDFQESEDVEEI